MVRASFERDACLCLLSRVLGRLHVCVDVRLCVRSKSTMSGIYILSRGVLLAVP